MSNSREPWWGFCRNIVRMYPVYLERYRALHEVSMTANYTGVPGAPGPSKSTEEVATRELNQTEQRSLDAVEAAIRATKRRKDGREMVMDTRQFREILEDTPLDSPEVLGFLRDYLAENTAELLAPGAAEQTTEG